MGYRRYASPPKPARWMELRYAGTCHVCGGSLAAGARAFYDPTTRQVTCTDLTCAEADGLTKTETVGPPWDWKNVTVLAERRIGQPVPMVDGKPIEYHPHQRGVFRFADGSDHRWFAHTRNGIRTGVEHTGLRCEDAPCCGCC